MRQTNTGNILGFYKVNNTIPDDTLQNDDYFNAPTRHGVGATSFLLPFQLVTTNTSYTFHVTDIDTGIEISTLSMDIQTTNDSRIIYTYFANSNLNLTNCKYYYVKVKDLLGRVKFMSEKIKVRTEWECEIHFTNNSDIGQVLYQNGYTQKYYFTPYEDFPLLDYSEEVQLTMSGQEIVTSSRHTERRRLTTIGVIDSSLSALKTISMHKTVTLIEKNPNESTNIERVTFDVQPYDNSTQLGVFTIQKYLASKTGCGENTFTLI